MFYQEDCQMGNETVNHLNYLKTLNTDSNRIVEDDITDLFKGTGTKMRQYQKFTWWTFW